MQLSALSKWNIRDYRILDIPVQGSPRRSMERYVVESGRLYVLERIAWHRKDRKEAQARILGELTERGLPVEHYLVSMEGKHVAEAEGSLWMLKEYVRGETLPRPKFLMDGWRGRVAARFLDGMRKAGVNPPDAPDMPYFISGMMKRMERRRPDVFRALRGPYEAVKPLLTKWHALPKSFSHGDFHPMNIIWGKDDINAVIDWEFMGMRPEGYDVAMMIGCLGIEDSEGLFSPFTREFLKEAGNYLSVEFLSNTLPPLLLVTRFAWMDEWVRNRDSQAVSAEKEFMSAVYESLEDIGIYFTEAASEHYVH